MSIKKVESVGVVLLDAAKVLLVKHGQAAGHINDTYGLPAGRIEVGETLTEATLRELQEETGLIAQAEHLVKLPDTYYAEIERKDGTTVGYNWTVFLCTKWSGSLESSEETSPEWHSLETITALNVLPNVVEAINQAKAHNN